ncbi:MAG: nucleoside triphosphate pyrophosphohydrolase [Myxococcota bacterium]|nr:nucleoside triphosphate pyrophosphohydrolase [Myxococcota bacterium]
MEEKSARAAEAFIELVKIVHRLRAPGGCPWDREQTLSSLKPYVIEEAYEVIEAIESGSVDAHQEELGDLLLQVVLQAEIADENASFSIKEVIEHLSGKLIHRHPHVFGEVAAETPKAVLENWEQLKKEEKSGRGLLEGLPKSMPGLQRAERIGEKAARVGFDWSDRAGVREKVAEELRELDEAVSSGREEAMQDELGDLLFAVAQWARHLGIRPEEALRRCCQRFTNRFYTMEKEVKKLNKDLNEADDALLDRIWQASKK